MKKLLITLLLILPITLCSCNTKTTSELLPYGLAFGDTYEQCVEKIAEIDGVKIDEIEKSISGYEELYGQETFSSMLHITDDNAEKNLNNEYFGIKEGISTHRHFQLLFNKNKELISFSFYSIDVEDSKFEEAKEKIINKFEKILNEENYSYQDEIFCYMGYWLTDEYQVLLYSDLEYDENLLRLDIKTRETYDIQMNR